MVWENRPDTDHKLVRWSTFSVILFQNGSHLKSLNSNKIATVIVNRFQLRLVWENRHDTHLKWILWKASYAILFQNDNTSKFEIHIKTVFLNRFEWNSMCINFLLNASPGLSYSFDGHPVSKWRPFKNFKLM